jgi:hypothetical protein
MTDEGEKPSQAESSSKDDEKAPVLQYFTSRASDTKLVTIRRLPSFQAQLAKAKLEAEGIQCFVQEDNFNVVYPVFFNDVPVQVAETDAEIAKEILDRPADAAAEGEYADEEYRCPKCHRKNVDLAPLSAGWKTLRRAYVIFLIMPLVLLAVKWLFPDPHLIAQIDALQQSAAIGWVLIALVGGIVVMGMKRRKRCRDCGREWGDAQDTRHAG